MPLTLATRVGPDTVGKLERAARRRYAEARKLLPTEPLGAVYLFGYTMEMRLKTAYFRVIGLASNTQISPSRRIAEIRIRALLGLQPNAPVGHNLYGWAKLLEDARAAANPMPLGFAGRMYDHVKNVQACWTEILRYRANKPYNSEVEAMISGALWFRLNWRRLWS